MGSNTWKKVKAGAKIALLGCVLLTKNEVMNLIDENEVNAASAHEAIMAATSQFKMVDEGEYISVKNRDGLEICTLPGNDETRSYYGNTIMGHDEYLLMGGKFSSWRRAVVNGTDYYMETYDPKTGDTLSMKKIENIDDDINNNYSLSVEELIDFCKMLAGENVIELPESTREKLSYYDLRSGNIVTGSPVTVLSSALQSAGFTEEQIDSLFEGTQFESADRKAKRIETLEESGVELASDQFREVAYYDAVRVGDKLDLSKLEEAASSRISQTIIDRYASFVKGSDNAADKVDEFTVMMGEYVKDCSDDEAKMKLAQVLAIMDCENNGQLGKERAKFDKKVQKLFVENGTNFDKRKGDKFDQFDAKMDDRIDNQLDVVDDYQTKYDRLQGATEEAMAFADEAISKGSINPEHYNKIVDKKTKEIEESCAGITSEGLEKEWDELDRLEKDKRKMQDYKFLNFVISECESKQVKKQTAEIAKINSGYFMDEEEAEFQLKGVRLIDEELISEPGEVKQTASSIVGLKEEEFYTGDLDNIEASDIIDQLTVQTDQRIRYDINNYYSLGEDQDIEDNYEFEDEDDRGL